MTTDDAKSTREPLVAERRRAIRELILAQGGASVDELASSLGVSRATIRRDLDWLEHRELIARTWGGGVPHGDLDQKRTADFELSDREAENSAEKALIAEAAAALVADGDSILVDGGSTAELMAPYLLSREHLTVITTSMAVACQLQGHANIELIMVGGRVQPRDRSVVGLFAEQTLSQVFADIAFIGARGLTLRDGLTNPVLDELPIKRLMLRIARRSVALVDSAKWGRVFMGLIAPISGFTTILTDASVPSDMREEVERMGTEVLIAGRARRDVSDVAEQAASTRRSVPAS